MSTRGISLPQLWEGNASDEQGKLPHTDPPQKLSGRRSEQEAWATVEDHREDPLATSSPLSHQTKGDAKHPSGSEDWRRLCGRKWASLKKYSQYLTLWVPIKKAREPTNPHTVMPVYITHISEVLKIRFYCPFLDVCFYWLLYLLPIGCLSLAFSVSFFTDHQCVQKTNGDCWKFHLNICILKKNLDFYLTPYTKLIKYGS